MGLQGSGQHADGDDREADGKGGGPEAGHLPDRGQEPVGVGDDEPGRRQGQDDAEDPWGPARPEVHGRSIVVRR